MSLTRDQRRALVDLASREHGEGRLPWLLPTRAIELEAEGLIRWQPSRHGSLYAITDSGRAAVAEHITTEGGDPE